jgi:hypothetical protein
LYTFISSMRAIYPTHLILPDFITLMVIYDATNQLSV